MKEDVVPQTQQIRVGRRGSEYRILVLIVILYLSVEIPAGRAFRLMQIKREKGKRERGKERGREGKRDRKGEREGE